MTTQSITSATRDQERRIASAIEDVAWQILGELEFDKEEAQRVIGRGGELKDKIRKPMISALDWLSISEEFANERAPSTFVYNLHVVNKIEEQVAILRELFPELANATFGEQLVYDELPVRAEGWFAIPGWWRIAPTYGEAVKRVLAVIDKRFSLLNTREGELGSLYLRQTTRKEEAFQKLQERQREHSILIVAAQFGLRYRGSSTRRSRVVMNKFEFGLGAFETGIMLLTHPERLVSDKDLQIDCAGDEYCASDDGRFAAVPFLAHRRKWFELGARRIDFAAPHFGSPSGFMPRQ